jgi:hypothetical protein
MTIKEGSAERMAPLESRETRRWWGRATVTLSADDPVVHKNFRMRVQDVLRGSAPANFAHDVVNRCFDLTDIVSVVPADVPNGH